jgi:hypothetical protein
MSERFLEIAKQAKLKFPSETSLSPMEEKFAELIVRECIARCNDLESMKYIADHFGVKIEGLNDERTNST